MTYEEYKKGFTDAISNPDTALTAIVPLFDELKSDLENMTTLKADVEAKDARIRDLQDTNLKLFLSQTAPDQDKKGEEKSEAVQAVDIFFADFNKKD